MMDSDQDDDVFEIGLDQIEIDSNPHDVSFSYPALPGRSLPSPDLFDDSAFEQFDEAVTPADEPFSMGSLPRSSPSKPHRMTTPRSEALAATLHLDGNKLRAMQSAFDHQEHIQHSQSQPQWFDALPGHPDAPESPKSLRRSFQSEIDDDEWGGPPFSQPKRSHRIDAVSQTASEPIEATVTEPKSTMFRSGFGPGLRFACRGSSPTSIRILRLNHNGVNPRLIDLHQKAVDKGDPLEDIAHAYKECPGDHWSLLIALFDPNFSSCHIHMRNALSNWLESVMMTDNPQLISSEIQHHIVMKARQIPGSDFWSEIASLLLGHRLGDAVSISLRHGNVNLATLIAENGAGLRGQSRQLIREQIKKWIISGTWQTFTETCQIVYRILAGDVLDAGSDWLSNLSAKFWFNDRPNEPMQSLVQCFQSSPYDIRRSLLEIRADPTIPTVRLFKGNPKHFDYVLMWHMYDILSRRGVILYGDAAWTLHLCYIAQLEAANQLTSALYVIIVGSYQFPTSTVSLLQDFLTRNWPKSGRSCLVSVQFGIDDLLQSTSMSEPSDFFSPEEVAMIEFVCFWTAKVKGEDIYNPMTLIYIAKYGRCLSDGNTSSAMTCAMRAGLWDSAYSIFITDIAPHLILTRNLEICHRLISQFASKMALFPQSWCISGLALVQILSRIEGQNDSEELSVEKGYISNVKHGPKSADALKRLHLLENAVQLMARRDAAHKIRLNTLF